MTLCRRLPDTYMQGKQQPRPVTYVDLPNMPDTPTAEDGGAVCIEMATPCWGEPPAGFE